MAGKKKQQHPIFYGLQEPLLVLRWAQDPGSKGSSLRGAIICRAIPFYRHLKTVNEEEGSLLLMPSRLVVGQVMNYVPLLEEHRLAAPAKAAESIASHLTMLNSSGYSLCLGYALDALKRHGGIEWGRYPARLSVRFGDHGPMAQLLVGSSISVPAFRTRWVSTKDVCRRTYEYVSKRADGNAESRGLSKRD